ncbi:hypothetical protein [Pacificibacter sp. AS14]|uniref:hypothetical protein n=1 Tax=Pacificibacter sp. AS14 TaxID=3135785 RepID=UPI00317F8298
MRNTAHQKGAKGPLSSFTGLFALGATVFVGPLVWPLISTPVTAILRDLYSYSTAQYLAWSMEMASYPITYFAIRAGVETVVTYLNVLVIKRLI